MIPGEYFLEDQAIVINNGRKTIELRVRNHGDRPVQIGSHYHFFEVNEQMEFDRAQARGMRLDIPAGTASRFEPGELKTVRLVAFAGYGQVFGHQAKVNGPV